MEQAKRGVEGARSEGEEKLRTERRASQAKVQALSEQQARAATEAEVAEERARESAR